MLNTKCGCKLSTGCIFTDGIMEGYVGECGNHICEQCYKTSVKFGGWIVCCCDKKFDTLEEMTEHYKVFDI